MSQQNGYREGTVARVIRKSTQAGKAMLHLTVNLDDGSTEEVSFFKLADVQTIVSDTNRIAYLAKRSGNFINGRELRVGDAIQSLRINHVEDKTKPDLNAEELRELCIIFKQKTRDLYALQAEIQAIREKITTLSTENDLNGTYNGVRVQIRHLFPQKENLELAKQSGIEIPVKEIEDLAKLREVAIEKGIPIPVKYKEDYLKLKQIFSDQGIKGIYKKNVALTILNKEERE